MSFPVPRYDADTPFAEIIDGIKCTGGAIIENLATPETMAAVSEELDPLVDAAPNGKGFFVGQRTKRISGLIKKAHATHALAADPLIMRIMDTLLLPNCERYQLHITQAVSVGAGADGQAIHRDRGMYQHCPWSIEPMINVMWAVSPFTEANGATRVAVGSHFWDQEREATEGDLSVAEMDTGSCFLYLGSTLHGAGANMTDKRRTGIIMGYCLGWLRQYENQYLAVPPQAAAQLSRELAGLIGYAAHRPHLGLYECRDPLDFLTDGLPENLPADDVPDAEMAAIVAQVLAERQASEDAPVDDDQRAA